MNTKNDFKRVLIIRTDRIGDVVLTTPAVRALRLAYPGAVLTMLVSEQTVGLVQGNPDLDDVLIDEREGRHKGWTGFWKLVGDIRVRGFDCVINFHTKKRTNLLCFLARIPRRVGYSDNNFGWLLSDRVQDDRHLGIKHESRYCLDLLKVIGVDSADVDVVLPVQDDAERWAEDFLKKCRSADPGFRAVALHMGASCPTKRWPVQYFSDLIRMMRQNNPRVFFVVIGAEEYCGMAADLKRLSGGCVFYDLTGRASLTRTVSLLKRCDLLISNDSGPVHIAAAFQTPVVSIFTRNQPGINPERWRPLGGKSRYVAPPLESEISFAKGEVEDYGFLYRVTPGQVFDAVDAVFQV